MKMSTRGLMMLCSSEGIVQEPYKDSVGVWTIGVGHTAAAGGIDPAKYRGKLSIKDCFDLLRKDIGKYERGVVRALQGKQVTQAQFDALVHFHYNTGAIGRASFMQHVRAGRMEKAASGMMAWRKPPEIIPRRTAERRLFETGHYDGNGMANVYPVRNGRPDFRNPTRIDLSKHLRPSRTGEGLGAGAGVGGAVIAAERASQGDWVGAIGFLAAGLALAAIVFFIIKKKRAEK